MRAGGWSLPYNPLRDKASGSMSFIQLTLENRWETLEGKDKGNERTESCMRSYHTIVDVESTFQVPFNCTQKDCFSFDFG